MVGAGIAVPALSARSEAAIARLADTASTEGAYRDLVARVAADRPARSGTPRSWVGESTNVIEFFVHTEDVRRGAGSRPAPRARPGARRRPVVAPAARRLRTAARGPRRQSSSSVTTASGTTCAHPRPTTAPVVVRGAVGELVLYLLGRGADADVRVEGQAEDVATIGAVLPSR